MEAAESPVPSAPTRTPLSKERVLRAAVELADREGIDALSMRRLAKELGVEAMSLYNHVANKDEILVGIVELVASEVEDPSTEGGLDWKTAIRRSAISTHDAFIRHRWSCPLMMKTAAMIPSRMRWMEALLRTLREAGFSPNLTHHAYHALDSHITGFTLWQVSFPFQNREELIDLAAEFMKAIPVDEYPYVIEHAQEHLDEPDPNEPNEFDFGLDLILDGLERMRDAA
jgi:AcrR family transcriptional regulator